MPVEDGMINTSYSESGWSFYGSGYCPRKQAFRVIAQLDMLPASALTLGHMGHTGLAHHYARQAIQTRGEVVVDGQRITDVNDLLDVRDAIVGWVKLNRANLTEDIKLIKFYLKFVVATVNRFIEEEGTPSHVAAAIEHEFRGYLTNYKSIGTEEGGPCEAAKLEMEEWAARFAMWEDNFGASDRLEYLRTMITNTASGLITKRLDCVMYSHGKYSAWDHKFTGMYLSKQFDSYSTDGQFGLTQLLMNNQFGVRNVHPAQLNLVKWEREKYPGKWKQRCKYGSERRPITFSTQELQDIPWLLWELRQNLLDRIKEIPPRILLHEPFQAAMMFRPVANKEVCWPQFKCRALDACKSGINVFQTGVKDE